MQPEPASRPSSESLKNAVTKLSATSTFVYYYYLQGFLKNIKPVLRIFWEKKYLCTPAMQGKKVDAYLKNRTSKPTFIKKNDKLIHFKTVSSNKAFFTRTKLFTWIK